MTDPAVHDADPGVHDAPDGQTAFITNQHADSLSVLDVATRTITATLTMDGEPNGLVFRDAPG